MFGLNRFFKPNQIQKFKQAVDAYLISRNYHDMQLSETEIEQLSWYMDSSLVTPEARETDLADKFHFEIKRGLARCYSMELLLRGDEKSYQEFVQSQRLVIPFSENNIDEMEKLLSESILSYENFQKYSKAIHQLSNEELALLRLSCFFTISNKAKEVLRENNITFSEDSEEFLSDISEIILRNYDKNKNLFPLTSNLTERQCKLLGKMYYRNLHLRHLMFAEGGVSMTESLSNGIKNGTFHEKEFELWKWRWLINLMGFKDAEVGKYFTAENEALTTVTLEKISNSFNDYNYQYLNDYLFERATKAGIQISKTTASETKFLGYLVASFNELTIITPKYGQAMLKGYESFKAKYPSSEIVDNYNKKITDPKAVTHTYVPAVLNNAYLIFKKDHHLSDKNAVQQATKFMCEFLDKLLVFSQQFSHQVRISCMQVARIDTLKTTLNAWYNNAYIEFQINDKHEIMVDITALKSSTQCIPVI